MCRWPKRFKRRHRPIEPGFAAVITEEVHGIYHAIVGYTLYGLYRVVSPILRFLKIDWLFETD